MLAITHFWIQILEAKMKITRRAPLFPQKKEVFCVRVEWLTLSSTTREKCSAGVIIRRRLCRVYNNNSNVLGDVMRWNSKLSDFLWKNGLIDGVHTDTETNLITVM